MESPTMLSRAFCLLSFYTTPNNNLHAYGKRVIVTPS